VSGLSDLVGLCRRAAPFGGQLLGLGLKGQSEIEQLFIMHGDADRCLVGAESTSTPFIGNQIDNQRSLGTLSESGEQPINRKKQPHVPLR